MAPINQLVSLPNPTRPSLLTAIGPLVLASTIFSGLTACCAYGQFAVAIVENTVRENILMKRGEKWGEDLLAVEKINRQLRTEDEHLVEADRTLKEINGRIGDPTTAAKSAFSKSIDAVATSSALIEAELRRATVESEAGSDDSLLRKNYLTNTALRTSYEIDGASHTRERERYRIFDQEEKLRDAFNQAIDMFQKTQLAERVFQAKQSRGMPSYEQTLSSIEARHAAIKGSRARVELARNRYELARIELESFIGQNDLEQRKLRTSQLEELDSLKEREAVRSDKLRKRTGL